ncbi:MAG: GGDEF domain-containing protein [Candidatus Eisenbacteria bacterium]|nr:GGDEF domain-containing protein [Candidatus Eisenbacteria bacterium]
MPRQPVTFQRVVTELLTQFRLSAPLQDQIQHSLGRGDIPGLERATLLALEELARSGVLLTDTRGLEPGQLRYYLPDGTAIVVVGEARAASGPNHRYSPGTRWGQEPSPESLRELLRIHEELLTRDHSSLRSPNELIRTLLDHARNLLEADGVNWVPSTEWGAGGEWDPSVVSSPTDPRELERVYREGHIAVWDDMHATGVRAGGGAGRTPTAGTDAGASEEGGTGGPPARVRSLAAMRVGRPDEAWTGVLEAWSRQPGWFEEGRLSLLETIAGEMGVLLRQLLQLQRFVFLDALTGLYNRSYYEMQMRRELARAQRDRSPLALLLCDVDNFKKFNTIYGYSGGDQVLHGVADILQRAVRPFDCVARYGGEEFVVILSPPVARDDARTIAERLRHAVAQARFEVTGLDRSRSLVGVTVSVGVALFPDDAQVEADLWRKANESVLRAKASGKNQVHFWGTT